MSAVVSGATRRQRPNPKMIDAGRKSVKYASGGGYVPGLFGSSFHGVLVAGTRTYQSTPSAMITGPAVMNKRAPHLADKPPNRSDREMRNSEPQIPAPPPATA